MVVLRAPVRAIAQTRRYVTLESDRLIVRADHAILAIPPTVAGQIRYSPALPTASSSDTAIYWNGYMDGAVRSG